MDSDLNRRVLLGSAGLVGVAALAALAKAGPISPPVGPVGSTGRTLLEVEPRIPVGPTTTPTSPSAVYRISQPGSYYLTGNVQGVSGKHGIEIAASNVTLDLCGFAIIGTGSGNTRGISAEGDIFGVTVLNGHVSGWSDIGILVGGSGALLSGLSSCNNASGILAGYSATVVDCVATGNTASGIYIDINCVGARCQARSNGTGFLLNQGSVYSECSAADNGIGFVAQSGGSTLVCLGDPLPRHEQRPGGHHLQLELHDP
jgi:hypothetical protein